MRLSELDVWMGTSTADNRTKGIFYEVGEQGFDHWLKSVNLGYNYIIRLIDRITFGAIGNYYMKKAEQPSTRAKIFVGHALEDRKSEYYFKAIRSTSSTSLMKYACVALADTYSMRADKIDAALAFYTFSLMISPKGKVAAHAYLGRGNMYAMHTAMFNQVMTKLSTNDSIAKEDLQAAVDLAKGMSDQKMIEQARECMQIFEKLKK